MKNLALLFLAFMLSFSTEVLALDQQPKTLKLTKGIIFQTEKFILAANHSDKKYSISVALPPTYFEQPDKKFAVMYLLDGHLNFSTAVGLSRWLFRKKGDYSIEQFVIVAIDYAYDDQQSYAKRDEIWFKSRYQDYTPVPTLSERHGQIKGQGEQFYQFISQALFDVIEKHYRVDPQQRTLAGYSLGGLFASFVLFKHPDTFSRYLIGDPSLWYAGKPKALTANDKCVDGMIDDNQCYLSNGIIFDYETQQRASGKALNKSIYLSSNHVNGGVMLFNARNLEKRLNQRKNSRLKLKAEYFVNEDHLSGVSRALQNGIRFLFGKNG
ncbi:MAG: alpha/beta hydrolase [Algicola sp.]|nr:alpha/beta hydrolase [Algicola sp.]